MIATPFLDRAGAERVVVDQAVELQSRGHVVTVASGGGALEVELARAGIPHRHVARSRRNETDLVRLVYFLGRVARDVEADVLHTHSLAWTTAALLGRRLGLHGARVVAYTMHGFNRPWTQRAIPILARGADVIFSVSEANRQAVMRVWRGGERIRTLHNGVRPPSRAPTAEERRAARRELGLSPEAGPVIGIVGRLVHLKGHDILLAAAADLGRRFPECVVLVAGDGPERAPLERAAAAAVPRLFRFLGSIDDVSAVYKAIDVLVLASRHEALPMVLLEAATYAVPSVATRVNGVPEIVAEGETGWMVPPEDPHALAVCLRSVLSEPDRLARAGLAARERVLARFAMVPIIDQLERELTVALEKRGRQ